MYCIPDGIKRLYSLFVWSYTPRETSIASKLILEAVNKGLELKLDEALALEVEQWRKCGATEDFNSAIDAFMAKKPVEFKGK